MLYANSGRAPRIEGDTDGVWLDLREPSDAEREAVATATGLRLPNRAALSEIESSSRLSVHGNVLTLSMPAGYRGPGQEAHLAPVGFVLSPDRLVTLRYADLPSFDAFAASFAERSREPCSVGAFIGLLEAIVDRQADVLERIGAELDVISHDVFRVNNSRKSQDRRLQAVLRSVGQKADVLANLRDGLLGVSRLAPYAEEVASAWIPADLRPRFKTLRADVASLSDYDTRLSEKVQFLLDATLGFINIEQNNGIKVLTVVSVVGVPPTLLASIYGMNFKVMPELQWHYGYAYGLAMIVLSGVLPLVWFMRRGWI